MFNLIVMNIERAALPNRYDKDLLELFKYRRNKDSIMICFMGFDEDPREICMIPECKQWLQGLFERVPQLFYYLTPAASNIEILFMTMLKNGEMILKGNKDSVFSVSTNEVMALEIKWVTQAIDYARKIGDHVGASKLSAKFKNNIEKGRE